MSSDEELFGKVEEFFFGNDEFANTLEAFCLENCAIFTEDEEQKLEYTVVYSKYQELFEKLIEDFLKANDCTLERFHSICKAASESQDEEKLSFVNLLVMSMDYDVFLMEMQRMAEAKRSA
ncbi:hypothetical protein CYMTET_3834 [Cymbomonas tetramitiformis]|uniref:Cilia- and flagella-associated protein 36 n=1 Tax=Cymbomonas tetramitiformis TaxID=36881 RepID=A0AAE0H2F6_9CHLO|nr:hypothetical protein CYMTET_3834 [Cymbomonas tetramitiformis]